MRIELDLPEWAGRSNLYILCETTPVAYKLKDGPWMVKTAECRMCGRCCTRHSGAFPMPRHPDGRCSYLMREPGKVERYRCRLGLFRPLQCCVGAGDENCAVRYEEVKP